MFKCFWRSVSLAVAVAAFTMSVIGHAQTGSAPTAAPSAVLSAWHAEFSKGWTPPRTPWGDPDLQGNFTWVDEVGTPMERPARFEGRGLGSLTQAEMDAINLGSQQRTVDGNPGANGGGATDHWYEGGGQYTKNSRAWLVLEPVDGKRPPLTAEAAELAKKPPTQRNRGSWSDKGQHPDSYTDWDLDDRCISGMDGNLGMSSQPHGNNGFIVQSPDYVVFQVEEALSTRVIPIKGRAGDQGRLPEKLRPYWGESVAWFEGNTMVVETVYPEKTWDVFGAPPQNTRTIERYTRRNAPLGIEWTMTVDNPTWWVRPWTWQERLTEDDRQVTFEYVCHETNHSIANALSGARDKDKRDAERAARGAPAR